MDPRKENEDADVSEIAPLDGGPLEMPPDVGEETEEERLKRLAAAEEHQERERKGMHFGKI